MSEVVKLKALDWIKIDPLAVFLTGSTGAAAIASTAAIGFSIFEVRQSQQYANRIIPPPDDIALDRAHTIFKNFSDRTDNEVHEALRRGDETVILPVNSQELRDANNIIVTEAANSELQQERFHSTHGDDAAFLGLEGLIATTVLLSLAAIRTRKVINKLITKSS